MERYNCNHIGDHLSQSSAKLPGTHTGRKNSMDPIGSAPVAEEQDAESEDSDIGYIDATRSPETLDIPLRTFRQSQEEGDDAEASKSSHKLLPDTDFQIDVSEIGHGGLELSKTHRVSGAKEQCGIIRRLPWVIFLSFLGNLTCTALSVYVLVASDQTPQASWSIQPSVYLAVLAPLGNILLRYCLSEGLVNDWWNLASRRTTLETLHNRWEYGTSLKSAATSFSKFDKISAAKILIAATFAVNPLLQRASRPYNQVMVTNVTVPFQLATTQSSFQEVGFKSVSTGTFYGAGQLSPLMVRVMRDYRNKSPIINQFGECSGNCTGTVRAAGLISDCLRRNNETYRMDHGMPVILGPAEVVFETGTVINTVFDDMIPFTAPPIDYIPFRALYVQTKLSNDNTSLPAKSRSCDGVSTTVICDLTLAVMDYPIVLRDKVISVDTRTAAIKVVQDQLSNKTDSTDGGDVLLGVNLAVNSIVQSNVTMSAIEDGWYYESTGAFSSFYMNNEEEDDQMTCAITSTDPTDDILTTFNEIMFRISLAALGNSSNSSLITEYAMTAYQPVILYQSHYTYLAAATFISLLACCSVLPMFNGFWRLDRSFSLSPIEIAKAFDAPLLRSSEGDTSDLPVDKLVKDVGATEVQYVAVADGDGEDMKLRQRKFVVAGVAGFA
ncbi:hypothetical protein KCU93_g8153, partial [Aureobasidium melanogenum]